MRDPLVIHVVRHGRTRSNRVGLVMGWADEPIEPDQHDAADAVAARMAAAPAPVRVVSSPLARARDTAAPLAAALIVDLETDDRLGELYQGPWQGLAESEVARRWPLEWSVWGTAPETLDLDGRETLTALYARVADAFDDLMRSSDAATVVVFTHDAVVRAAVAWTLRVGPATYRHIDVANCSITTIHVSHFWPEAGCPQRHQPPAGQRTMILVGSDATQIRRRSAPRRALASRSLIGRAHPRGDAVALTGPVTQLRVHSAQPPEPLRQRDARSWWRVDRGRAARAQR